MKTATIEELAYKLKKRKNANEGAIFFLGAGVSATAGIPLANTLIEDIITQHGENPSIRNLSDEDKKDYYKLMEKIDHEERKMFFKTYIDKAQINVSHIYLAHMMEKGFVDYILTVNFDNITQRALSLFNQFPAVYDIAILKGLNTSTFDNPGIVFLHGQHHGFNMLNTKAEFEEAKELIVSSLQRICGRPWVIVGYSGNDAVFDYISKLGRFDNGLYWVSFKEEDPSENVKDKLLKNNNNSFIIKGYDADTFFLKLNAALQLGQPAIIDKPFTHLKKLQESIIDIDGENYEMFKERLGIGKKRTNEAITQYEIHSDESFKNEEGNVDKMYKKLLTDIAVDNLKKELIDAIANEKFDVISEIEAKAKKYCDTDLDVHFAKGYHNWGKSLYWSGQDKGKNNDAKVFYEKSIQKYKQAYALNSNSDLLFNDWGLSLSFLAELQNKEEGRLTLFECIEKYKTAESNGQKHSYVYNNWGLALYNLARYAHNDQKEKLLIESIEKFKTAVDLDPNQVLNVKNWGSALSYFAEQTKSGKSKELFLESIEKYELAAQIDPGMPEYYQNISSSYICISRLVDENEKNAMLQKAIINGELSKRNGGSTYNLACANAIRRNDNEALLNLKIALENKMIEFHYVELDVDWEDLRSHPKYIQLKAEYGDKQIQ